MYFTRISTMISLPRSYSIKDLDRLYSSYNPSLEQSSVTFLSLSLSRTRLSSNPRDADTLIGRTDQTCSARTADLHRSTAHLDLRSSTGHLRPFVDGVRIRHSSVTLNAGPRFHTNYQVTRGNQRHIPDTNHELS